MILTIAALLAAQAPLEAIAGGGSFRVPPPMVPHLTTYIQCVEEHRRADPRKPAPYEVAKQVAADSRAACSEVRKSVAAASEKALARVAGWGGKRQRVRTVETTLVAYERMSDELLDAMLSLPDPNTLVPK